MIEGVLAQHPLRLAGGDEDTIEADLSCHSLGAVALIGHERDMELLCDTLEAGIHCSSCGCDAGLVDLIEACW